MLATTASTATLTDGRTLAFAEFGDRSGQPVLALHGTPGCRLSFAKLHDAAARAGVRLIATDHPGFGASTAHPLGFTSFADDLRQLLDTLGIGKAAVLGASGGGGYALAAGMAMPDRITRVLLVAAMVPQAPAEARLGMAPMQAVGFRIARRTPAVARLLFGRAWAALAADPKQAMKRGRRTMCAADQAVILSAGYEHVALEVAEAIRQGPRAGVEDLRLYTGAAGFDLSDVQQPVVLFHGLHDTNVPIGVARWTVRQLRAGRLVELDAGHLLAASHADQIVDAATG